MPTFFSHSLVGLAAGKACAPKKLPARFWVLSAVCPALPDADVIGFAFGIPYGHFLGHRGFFHSLSFALLLGIVVKVLFFGKTPFLSKRGIFYALFFFLITATHGVLDAFTSGGLGIALFSPFDQARYFFPWTPIHVSPIGVKPFFSRWGLAVIISELLWVWLPALALLFGASWFRHERT